jgi:hypothetical protein
MIGLAQFAPTKVAAPAAVHIIETGDDPGSTSPTSVRPYADVGDV